MTQTTSTRFGDLAGPSTTVSLELRASWTADDPDLSAAPARLRRPAVHGRRPAARGCHRPRPGLTWRHRDACRRTRHDASGRRRSGAARAARRRARAAHRPGPSSPSSSRASRAGSGPVALDAERASGYRYSQRAYLVQLRRAGAGTALIDPIALPDLRELDDGHRRGRVDPARRDPGPRPAWPSWACVPRRLFDTELAGRLLGDERVALAHHGRAAPGRAAWRRATPRPTGRPGRCPTTGWSTPRSTSSCSSPCATRWPTSSPRRARPSGPGRSSRPIRAGARRRHRAPTRGGAPRASTSCAPAASSPPCGRCGRRATSYAAERDIAPGRVLPDSAIIEAARAAPGASA